MTADRSVLRETKFTLLQSATTARDSRCRLPESGFEACLAKPRVITRKERIFAQLQAVVTRVRIADNLAWHRWSC